MPIRATIGRMSLAMAPEPEGCAPNELPANRVVSVLLNDGEEAQWMWTTLPGGGRYVSGYRVVKKGQHDDTQK